MSSIFNEAWWWSAASNGSWHSVEARVGNDWAVFPYVVAKTFGLRKITLPPYTRLSLPDMRIASSNAAVRARRRTQLVQDLKRKLPRHDRFYMTFGPSTELGLPFCLNGYEVAHQYSFVLGASESLDARFESMEQKTRNLIRSSAARFAIAPHREVSRFIALSRRQRGAHDKNQYGTLERLCDACFARDQAEVLSVVDEDGGDAAAAIVLRDATTAYLWLTARDPDTSRSGALAFLVWEAARQAHGGGLDFDLDGFGGPRGAIFLSNFGFRPVVRLVVASESRLWAVARTLRFVASRDDDRSL